MDTKQIIPWVLIVLNFIFRHCMSQDVYRVQEGDTAFLQCSGNAVTSIWYISWVLRTNYSRIPITKCYTEYDETCTEDIFFDSLKHHCTEETYIQGTSFTSQLNISNVTQDLRYTVIECIMGDNLYRNTDDILLMSTYNMSVYHLPEASRCNATHNKDNAIKISCQVLKVYPEIRCRIFPEVETLVQSSGSEVRVAKLTEITNVKFGNHKPSGTVLYYDSHCTAMYYPDQKGIFRFRVQLYFTENLANPVLNISTNFVSVFSVLGNVKSEREETEANAVVEQTASTNVGQAVSTNVGQTASTNETNRAFYMLMGSIFSLGLTVLLIVSWVIWVKRKTCCPAPNTTGDKNLYESIDYTVQFNSAESGARVVSSDEGYGESAGGTTMLSDSENDEPDICPQIYLDQSGYIPNIPVPRPHYTNTKVKSGNCGDYIVPATPTSTLSRSPGIHNHFNTSSREDLSSQTYSKEFV